MFSHRDLAHHGRDLTSVSHYPLGDVTGPKGTSSERCNYPICDLMRCSLSCCAKSFLQIGQSSFQTFPFFLNFPFPFPLLFFWGKQIFCQAFIIRSFLGEFWFPQLITAVLWIHMLSGVYLSTFCKFLLFPLPLRFFLSCSPNSLQLFSESRLLLLLILEMLFYSLQSEIKKAIKIICSFQRLCNK